MIGRARAAALAAVALAMIAAAVWFGRQTLTASTTASIPTTRVQRGPVQARCSPPANCAPRGRRR